MMHEFRRYTGYTGQSSMLVSLCTYTRVGNNYNLPGAVVKPWFEFYHLDLSINSLKTIIELGYKMISMISTCIIWPPSSMYAHGMITCCFIFRRCSWHCILTNSFIRPDGGTPACQPRDGMTDTTSAHKWTWWSKGLVTIDVHNIITMPLCLALRDTSKDIRCLEYRSCLCLYPNLKTKTWKTLWNCISVAL